MAENLRRNGGKSPCRWQTRADLCIMDKKRSEGKHYYVYTVAGSAKFLRVYYARVTEFLRSQPSSDAC